MGQSQAKRMRPCGNSDGNNAGSPDSRLLQRGSVQDLKAEGPLGPMGHGQSKPCRQTGTTASLHHRRPWPRAEGGLQAAPTVL